MHRLPYHFLLLSLACLSLCACAEEENIPDFLGEENQAPVALLSSPTSGRAGQALLLDGTASSDDVQVQAWWFDPGDGSPVYRSASPTIYHTYAEPGRYEITLSVLDNQGAKDIDNLNIYIR